MTAHKILFKVLLLTLMLSGTLPATGTAQIYDYYLSLENPGKLKRHRLYPGDSLGFRVRGQEEVIYGRINDVRPDTVIINGDVFTPADFSTIVRIQNRTTRFWINMLSYNLVAGAVYATVMYAINLPQYDLNWRNGSMIAGAVVGMVVLSRVVRIAMRRKYPLGERWRVQVLEAPQVWSPEGGK